MLRLPAPNATQVAPDTIIRVGLYDLDYDFDPDHTFITFDGVVIYLGTAFAPEFLGRGFHKVIGGRSVLEFVPQTPFAYGSQHTILVQAQDFALNTYADTWTFTIRPDPTCYTGNGLLDLEALILTPMQRFLDLEPLRLLLLQQALVNTAGVVPNRDNVAARALYQMAYDTEISGVLNAYAVKDEAALATRVCTKRKTLDISAVLDGNLPLLERGIESIFTQGALPREYRNNFRDYLDSMLYTYKVSLACNMVFLARAVEHAAGL